MKNSVGFGPLKNEVQEAGKEERGAKSERGAKTRCEMREARREQRETQVYAVGFVGTFKQILHDKEDTKKMGFEI